MDLPLILLFKPLPRDSLAHLVNSSIAWFGFAGGVLLTLTVRGATTGFGFGAVGAAATVPLTDLGAAGPAGEGFGLPPAPTVVQAPELAVVVAGAGALLARSAYRFTVDCADWVGLGDATCEAAEAAAEAAATRCLRASSSF